LSGFRRTLRWSAWDGPAEGLEHAEIRPVGGGLLVESAVVGRGFALAYRLLLTADWTLTAADVSTMDGRRASLRATGSGAWLDADGRPLPALDGCVDIDIEATPLTNTLPIRRLPFGPGEARDLALIHVSAPSLAVSVARQRYARTGRGYRFESLDSDFAVDLPVDEDGFVLDYPGLFRRVPI